jgi:hypothetical protein
VVGGRSLNKMKPTIEDGIMAWPYLKLALKPVSNKFDKWLNWYKTTK